MTIHHAAAALIPLTSATAVQRSNAIIARLRHTARALPEVRTQLGALPMHLVAEVAGVRIGIVHGDAESLAGWSYSECALSSEGGIRRAADHFEAGACASLRRHTRVFRWR